MSRKRKILGILLFILAVACFAAAWYMDAKKKENEDIYEKLTDLAVTEKETPKQEPEYVSPIDFEALWAVNPDIYAWIQIPGTNIQYPIVQSPTDDSYYLDHTVEGKKGYPGSIYTERLNSKDFNDFNTVIYGHNMKDGTMFKGLHYYEDEQYMKEHSVIEIYTPEEKRTYRVFAAVVYSDMHILNNYDFSLPEHRQIFLDSIMGARNARNAFDREVPVGSEDKILTLSTCIAGQADKRYIVEAVLTDG